MSVSQSDFHAALLDSTAPVPSGLRDGNGRAAGSRFSVYRNNVAVSLTEALEVNFPAVRKLIGEKKFRAMAGIFLRQHPPEAPMISQYGTEMPEFLKTFQPLAHIGYLPDVARLELALRQSYHAADATPVDPATLGNMAPEALMGAHLDLAPALRLLRSDWPVHGIWSYKMEPAAPKAVHEPQNVLILRPDFDPRMTVINNSAVAFLQGLLDGTSLGTAHDRGIGVDPDFDLAHILGLLIGGQAITNIITGES